MSTLNPYTVAVNEFKPLFNPVAVSLDGSPDVLRTDAICRAIHSQKGRTMAQLARMRALLDMCKQHNVDSTAFDRRGPNALSELAFLTKSLRDMLTEIEYTEAALQRHCSQD